MDVRQRWAERAARSIDGATHAFEELGRAAGETARVLGRLLSTPAVQALRARARRRRAGQARMRRRRRWPFRGGGRR